MTLPLPLGFYLVKEIQYCASWPDVRYRGIDRGLVVPDPLELDDWRASGRKRLAELWDWYFETTESGLLSVDGEVAQELCRELQSFGIKSEVIYAEISAIPQDLSQYPHGELWAKGLKEGMGFIKRRLENIPGLALTQRPPSLAWLGYDVAHPTPWFHSAIVQPGLHHICPTLPTDLNQNGLLPNLGIAEHFMEEANKMDYGTEPFCVVAVFLRAPSGGREKGVKVRREG